MYWYLNNAAEGRAERRAERRATGGCFLDPSARKQRKNPPSLPSQAPRTGQDGFRRRDWALQLNSRRLVAKHQRRKHPQHPASLPPLACPALLLSVCLSACLAGANWTLLLSLLTSFVLLDSSSLHPEQQCCVFHFPGQHQRPRPPPPLTAGGLAPTASTKPRYHAEQGYLSLDPPQPS